MPLIDERGRIGGRINLIDFCAAVFLFFLIPLAYGAYRLFRQPEVQLVSIEPAELPELTASHITIHGHNLLPFLKAQARDASDHFTPLQYRVFSTEEADVALPDTLKAGQYALTVFQDVNPVIQTTFTVVSPVTVTRYADLSVHVIVPQGVTLAKATDGNQTIQSCEMVVFADLVSVGLGPFQFQQRMDRLNCRVRVPLDKPTDHELRSQGVVLKAGTMWDFTSPQTGYVQGRIESVKAE